jgi:hypothetical protein
MFPKTLWNIGLFTELVRLQSTHILKHTSGFKENESLPTCDQVHGFREDLAEADIPIWKEALFAADLLLLHSSPVYYGFGIPRGDGSPVEGTGRRYWSYRAFLAPTRS